MQTESAYFNPCAESDTLFGLRCALLTQHQDELNPSQDRTGSCSASQLAGAWTALTASAHFIEKIVVAVSLCAFNFSIIEETFTYLHNCMLSNAAFLQIGLSLSDLNSTSTKEKLKTVNI